MNIPAAPFPALIAFDFDGTMSDTEEITLPDFWVMLNEDYGIPMTREVWMKSYHGKAGPSLITELNAAYGTTMAWPEFVARRNKRLPALFAKGLALAPGLAPVLKKLHDDGQLFCICTNSQGERNVLALAHLGLESEDHRLYLQSRCLSAVDEGRNAKPAPDVYRDAAARFQVKPGHCIAVEDTVTGLTAAVAAGYVALGYTGLSRTPEHDTELLAKAGATAVFNHWDAFLPLLGTLKPKTA